MQQTDEMIARIAVPPPKSVRERLLLGSWCERQSMLSHLRWRLTTQWWYRWQFAYLGSQTTIRKPMMLAGPQFIRIGARVHIRDGVRLEAIQTHAARKPQLEIGDDVNIEQGVHIICHSRVTIGPRVSITGRCAIVDVTHPYEDVWSPLKIGDRILDEDSFVEIGEGSFLGYGAVILPNVRIGKQCVIGANSVVSQNIPDYTVAAGIPARQIRRYDAASGTWVRIEEQTS